MKVPFLNLHESTDQIKKEYLKRVKALLNKSNYILTEEVVSFEKKFAAAISTEYSVGISSCADALYLALAALDIGPGDEVITQGNAYNASVTAILRSGATPRFADIHEDSLTLNPANIEPLINAKTKAILPVHLYGQANDMSSIMRIANKHKLFVIEDAAQAHLAMWDGKQVGTFGDIGCFSFYPTKNLGAFGDAGAIVTNNKKLFEKIRALRNLGQVAKNDHRYLGFNHRLDAMQAIALELKLPYLISDNANRKAAATHYDMLLKPLTDAFCPVATNTHADHVHHLYVIKSLRMSREAARQGLEKLGVSTEIHYPVPVYQQPFYKGHADACPITDRMSEIIFSLPLYTGITKEEQNYVVACLTKL